MSETSVEPWLRGTLTETGAVTRAVLHALELAREDIAKWCGDLSDPELNDKPSGLPSVAFQIRHLSRSMDRLLTYAEGRQLSAEQLVLLKSEQDQATGDVLKAEFASALEDAEHRVRALDRHDLEQSRGVGKRQLPTTVGGLLVHVADHTQRHVGQAITTAKVVMAQRSKEIL